MTINDRRVRILLFFDMGPVEKLLIDAIGIEHDWNDQRSATTALQPPLCNHKEQQWTRPSK
jgi:hypothetical protein